MPKIAPALCALCLCMNVAPAQQSQPTTQSQPASEPAGPRVVRMTIHAAAAPVPSLKYQLMPPISQVKTGNAALFYYQAILCRGTLYDKEYGEFNNKLQNALDAPFDPQWLEKTKPLLSHFDAPMGYVAAGAYRDSCDWGFLNQGTGTLIPSLSPLRSIAKNLALKIRVEIAEEKNADALNDLQIGLAYARHVGQAPMLIQAMVGVWVTNLMLDQAERFIQLPTAPNLYWAVAAVPSPVADFHPGLLWEREILPDTYPALKDLRSASLSPSQMEALRTAYSEMSCGLNNQPAKPESWDAWTKQVQPEAKKHLLANGYDPKAVDAMPTFQVALIYGLDSYNEIRDEVFQWLLLPYRQGYQGLQHAEEKIARAKNQPGASHFLNLVPQLHHASFVLHSAERRLAILQCIEAIRMYAASHDNQLPAALSDLKESPAPIDPITGKEFAYKVTGNQAVLEGPALPGEDPSHAVRYELTLVK
jgi:hypothetical protein